MWKKVLWIAGMALVIGIVGYQIDFLRMRREQKESSGTQEAQLASEESDAILTGNESGKITRSTKIIIESYDANGKLLERSEQLANADLVGNNRLETLIYAGSYQEQAPEEELRAGLERMELESFSTDTVTLVKYYGEPVEEAGYYIGVKDNVVIVYLKDRSEVYEYTNIELWMLPEEIQSQLVDGIYVDNEQELFDFLQTYSS